MPDGDVTVPKSHLAKHMQWKSPQVGTEEPEVGDASMPDGKQKRLTIVVEP
jgi:hypothetical protein